MPDYTNKELLPLVRVVHPSAKLNKYGKIDFQYSDYGDLVWRELKGIYFHAFLRAICFKLKISVDHEHRTGLVGVWARGAGLIDCQTQEEIDDAIIKVGLEVLRQRGEK